MNLFALLFIATILCGPLPALALSAAEKAQLDGAVARYQSSTSASDKIVNGVYADTDQRIRTLEEKTAALKIRIATAQTLQKHRLEKMEKDMTDVKGGKLFLNPYSDKSWLAETEKTVLDYCCRVRRDPELRKKAKSMTIPQNGGRHHRGRQQNGSFFPEVQ